MTAEKMQLKECVKSVLRKMNRQNLKEIGNLDLLIPTVSHAGHALMTLSLRSRNAA